MKAIATISFSLLPVIFVAAFGRSLPDHVMEKANQAYIDEAYQEAVSLYEKIAEMEWESASLYYNLGNAYYQKGMLGKAILNYERALRLNPSDEAIRHNLRIAVGQTADRIEPLPRLFFLDWHDRYVLLQPVDAWAKNVIILVFLTALFIALFFVARKKVYKQLCAGVSMVLILLTLAGFYAAGRQYYTVHEKQEAIVMASRVVVKSAPGERGIDLFLVHEGTRVEISNTVRDWSEIRLANGNIGWIERRALEEI